MLVLVQLAWPTASADATPPQRPRTVLIGLLALALTLLGG